MSHSKLSTLFAPRRLGSLVSVCVCLGVMYLGGCGGATLTPPTSNESGGVESAIDALESGMEEGDGAFDHQSYDQLLSEHVNLDAGTVDYSALQQHEEGLEQYLERIADVDLSTLPRDEQLALLINAYNGYTLQLILEHYPDIDSIQDLSEPWSQAQYEVGGHTLSLDQIEREIIRPVYQDPRIHFAVNCAAVDCPYLADFAYKGDKIDEQLESRTEAILSNEQFVQVESEELRYPKVMKWYRSDFTDDSFQGSASNVAEYIASHTRDEVRTFINEHDGAPPISPLDYDWSLNDAE